LQSQLGLCDNPSLWVCERLLYEQILVVRRGNWEYPNMFCRYVIFFFLLAIVPHIHAGTLINGAGATFPCPIYVKWFEAYAKVNSIELPLKK